MGIVNYRDNRSFVMADIPGIIEGAHLGKGLGLRFLRHIERNSVLLFMVPSDSEDIHGEYKILLNELKQYNPELLDKKRLLAISKSDFIDKELMSEMEKDLPDIPYVGDMAEGDHCSVVLYHDARVLEPDNIDEYIAMDGYEALVCCGGS